MTTRIFGSIPGYPEGYLFESRAALSAAGVHRPRQAGISGSKTEGADSIVLSGGYEDDEDHGNIIIYTGHGGRDERTGQQISDQLMTNNNLALTISCLNGLPVRLIRGASHHSNYAPRHGYQYGGLYRVESYWRERGKAGYIIWRYRLIKLDSGVEERQLGIAPAEKITVTIQRIIRDTKAGRQVKEIYDYKCQICNVRLVGSSGAYAEAAHIRPLGTPHNGPDTLNNLLCLCPNHHVLFDYGAIAILDDFTLLGIDGRLNISSNHLIDVEYLQYRRHHFYSRG